MYANVFYFIILIYYVIGLLIYLYITNIKRKHVDKNIININSYNELLLSDTEF